MRKALQPKDNASNISNGNKGSPGVNKQFQQAQTNTDRQRKKAAAGRPLKPDADQSR